MADTRMEYNRFSYYVPVEARDKSEKSSWQLTCYIITDTGIHTPPQTPARLGSARGSEPLRRPSFHTLNLYGPGQPAL